MDRGDGRLQCERAGVRARGFLDKQEPSAEEIAKNFDQTREQILDQRRGEVFQVFASNVFSDYKKHNRVMFNKARSNPQLPGE